MSEKKNIDGPDDNFLCVGAEIKLDPVMFGALCRSIRADIVGRDTNPAYRNFLGVDEMFDDMARPKQVDLYVRETQAYFECAVRKLVDYMLIHKMPIERFIFQIRALNAEELAMAKLREEAAK